MKNLILIFLTLSINHDGFAQKPCSCKELMVDLSWTLETNYVERGKLLRNKLYLKIKREIASTEYSKISDECVYKINEMIAAIRDRHVSFNILHDTLLTGRIMDSIDLTSIYRKSSGGLKSKFSVEGLWDVGFGSYQYVVVKNHKLRNSYNIIIWSSIAGIWQKGDLKGTLTKINNTKYLYKNYLNKKTVTAFEVMVKNNTLYSSFTGFWKRKKNFEEMEIPFSREPSIQNLTGGEIILKLPSFALQYQIKIDSLLNRYSTSIRESSHLIIDIRDNIGGSTRTYKNVLKYIYTNPIRIENAYFLSSPDNIQQMRGSLSRMDSFSLSYANYKNLVVRMEKNPGKLVLDTGGFLKFDTIANLPKNVSILVNDGCGSAGEFFLLAARQSSKVKLFGQPSYGAVDRADAYVYERKNFRVSIPISLRIPEYYKKPIDNIGIPPDVYLPKNIDWVDFVIKYNKDHND